MKHTTNRNGLSAQKRRRTILYMILGFLLAVAVLAPVFWMFMTSVMRPVDLTAKPLKLIPDEITFDRFRQVFASENNMDFVKYRIFPKGYMIRTSSENHREQVRISREAVKNGISFERIGNSFLNKYKEDDNILAAKVLFITAPNVDYAELLKCARQVSKITLGLTKILEGMSTDCTTCQQCTCRQ